MIEPVLLVAALWLPQESKPTVTSRPADRPTDRPASRPADRPASRPTAQAQLTDRERMIPAEWGPDAPGRAVMSKKFLPLNRVRYASADQVKGRVRDTDLVIGLVVGGKAVAYPINMLGGPQREIINEDYAGVRFCVNW